MNQWSEENFLDRLMPELRRESRVRAESCPDAELLTAFAEDRVSGFVRESVTAHLAQCRQCSEICARLVNFDMGVFSAQDAEWPNAGKRLTNWMEGLLAGKGSAAPIAAAGVAGVREVPRAGLRWAMPWALGAAAALGVIVGGVVVGGMLVAQRGWRNPGPVQVARARPSAETPTPVVAPAPAPSPQPATGGKETAKTPEVAPTATHSPAAPTSAAPTPPTEARALPAAPEKHTTSLAKISHSNQGASVAANGAPRPVARSTAGAARAASVYPAPAIGPTPALVAPQPAGNSAQVAPQFEPPNLNPNDRIQAETEGRSSAGRGTTTAGHAATKTASAKGLAVSLRSGGAATSARPPSPSTVPLPAQLRLEANQRLWIRASLLNQNPDGTFTFSGNLLQPVEQGGVQLDSETRLEGAGLVKDGAVTISVNSLKYRGVFYFLQMSNQSGDQKPGAGKALQFHGGQIIEMWFLAPSVYEKQPASADPSKP